MKEYCRAGQTTVGIAGSNPAVGMDDLSLEIVVCCQV